MEGFIKLSLFDREALKEIRAECVKELGGDISDEEWEQVIKDVEEPIIKDLQRELPKAFWFSMYEMAEKGKVIVEIDGKDIGQEIRQLRPIYEWLNQKKKYFGW